MTDMDDGDLVSDGVEDEVREAPDRNNSHASLIDRMSQFGKLCETGNYLLNPSDYARRRRWIVRRDVGKNLLDLGKRRLGISNLLAWR